MARPGFTARSVSGFGMNHDRGELTIPGLVDGLVHMVAHRDTDTGLHLDAVGELAGRLALHLGLGAEIAERVTLAGRLHDVGKHTVSLDILRKPAALSDDEWIEMRMHPAYGAGILKGFAPLLPFVEIVRLHHERVDGRGYPDGRMGNEIPVESRIIAVVDAFHAMTVTRPYTPAKSPGYAIGELIRCAGTQFDVEFVEGFLSMLGMRGGISAHEHRDLGSTG